MTPRRRVRWSQRIDWAAVNFAFVALMAILGAAMTYAYLNGATASRLLSLEQRIAALERASENRGRE